MGVSVRTAADRAARAQSRQERQQPGGGDIEMKPLSEGSVTPVPAASVASADPSVTVVKAVTPATLSVAIAQPGSKFAAVQRQGGARTQVQSASAVASPEPARQQQASEDGVTDTAPQDVVVHVEQPQQHELPLAEASASPTTPLPPVAAQDEQSPSAATAEAATTQQLDAPLPARGSRQSYLGSTPPLADALFSGELEKKGKYGTSFKHCWAELSADVLSLTLADTVGIVVLFRSKLMCCVVLYHLMIVQLVPFLHVLFICRSACELNWRPSQTSLSPPRTRMCLR